MSASRGRRFVFSLILVVIGLVMAGVLAEVALRVFPVPGITFHTFYFDEVTGQRFYPGTTLIYRNERGTNLKRRVNGWGYLGAEHEIEKPAGMVRIGFFGDSFTEARQVPLDETFPRRIERALNERSGAARYECIAIAMAGYSTTQGYLECRRWMDDLALDHVVYVFCENDPGNNVPALNMSDTVPYPVLLGDSLAIDNTFAARYANKTRPVHRVWQFLKSHTLLFSTLETRIRLLRSHGVKLRVDEAERAMEMPAGGGGVVSANSPPSALSDSMRTWCETITGRVLLEWKGMVDARGATFDILYVPRRNEMAKPFAEQDSWAPWLIPFCAANGIGFVDPSPRFVRAEAAGEDMYFDHLTTGGHDEMAAAFVEYAAAWSARHKEQGEPRGK